MNTVKKSFVISFWLFDLTWIPKDISRVSKVIKHKDYSQDKGGKSDIFPQVKCTNQIYLRNNYHRIYQDLQCMETLHFWSWWTSLTILVIDQLAYPQRWLKAETLVWSLSPSQNRQPRVVTLNKSVCFCKSTYRSDQRHDCLSKSIVEIGYNSCNLSLINWVWY